ncbi:hypothetical protein [Aeromicrobium massiliense]|uniref:hypothetical protein n=1 Tax=Aeromicrobium massiliense TaxID=1464554 RepID=UPI000300D890|nr:hypothetical protein [Aeromicrobium massiliense]
MSTDKRGHNAVKGKQGFQPIRQAEPATATLNGPGTALGAEARATADRLSLERVTLFAGDWETEIVPTADGNIRFTDANAQAMSRIMLSAEDRAAYAAFAAKTGMTSHKPPKQDTGGERFMAVSRRVAALRDIEAVASGATPAMTRAGALDSAQVDHASVIGSFAAWQRGPHAVLDDGRVLFTDPDVQKVADKMLTMEDVDGYIAYQQLEGKNEHMNYVPFESDEALVRAFQASAAEHERLAELMEQRGLA